MNIIIPMAGRGTRLRPHTLTTPKPLVHVAGRPIVDWLVEDIVALCPEKVDNIGFIIGDFGAAVEQQLLRIAAQHGAQGHIFYQQEALGTAHAIQCAKTILTGKVVVAFADTLFKTGYVIDTTRDAVIFVQQVDDPSAFGVVKMNDKGQITEFVEKPKEFISDLAIIGIYFFRDGEALRSEIQYLLDNDIREKGEYQLTNAMENMKNKGMLFYSGTVQEWLDCGNKDATVYTNQRVLEIKSNSAKVADTARLINATIIPPCFIGENADIRNSVIGPYVSVGGHSEVLNSVISNSIIGEHAVIRSKVFDNSMVGNHVSLTGHTEQISIGDFTQIQSS
jgi:glucose-1-phosphate thymidylyltransferase